MATDRSMIPNAWFWKDIVHRWWRRALLLLAVPTIITIAFACLYRVAYTPRYKTTATLYVLPSATGTSAAGTPTTEVAMPDDLTMSDQLLADCVYLFGSSTVADRALELAHIDMTTDALIHQTTVSNPAETHIIEITVRDADTARAQKLVQALCEAGMEATEQLVGYQPILVHEAGRVDELPYNRLQMGHCVLVWIVVLLLCVVILKVPAVFSRRPKDPGNEAEVP